MLLKLEYIVCAYACTHDLLWPSSKKQCALVVSNCIYFVFDMYRAITLVLVLVICFIMVNMRKLV